MDDATRVNVVLLDSYETEWRALSEYPCNLLLEGAVTATDAVLRLLQPSLGEPIRWHRPHMPLDLSDGRTRTLILADAAVLDGDDQRRLLAWSRDTGSDVQLISMTARPLFALVAAGLFDAALYYRLNVMLLRVGAPHHARQPSDEGEGERGTDWERVQRSEPGSCSTTLSSAR